MHNYGRSHFHGQVHRHSPKHVPVFTICVDCRYMGAILVINICAIYSFVHNLSQIVHIRAVFNIYHILAWLDRAMKHTFKIFNYLYIDSFSNLNICKNAEKFR